MVVRPLRTFMKKTIFTILWMLVFLSAGFVIFCFAGYVIARPGIRSTGTSTLDDNKVRLIMVIDWLCVYGLPILALILGIFGKLPGTRIRKDLAHEPVV